MVVMDQVARVAEETLMGKISAIIVGEEGDDKFNSNFSTLGSLETSYFNYSCFCGDGFAYCFDHKKILSTIF